MDEFYVSLTLPAMTRLWISTEKMKRGTGPCDEEVQSELPKLYSRQPPAIKRDQESIFNALVNHHPNSICITL